MTLESISPVIAIVIFLIACIVFFGGTALILSVIYSRPSKPKIYCGIDLAIMDQISPVIILWHDPNGYYPYNIKIYSDVLNLNTGEDSIEKLAETVEEFVNYGLEIIARDQ